MYPCNGTIYDRLGFWCQKILPLVYDESLSYYEMLCKMADYIKYLLEEVKDLKYKYELRDADIEQLKKDVAELQDELEKVKNGEYVDKLIPALSKWIDENLQQLVSRIVKYVMFGLSNDGYFMACIPESWDFMEFDTIMDSNSPLYGHLVMQW